MFFAHLYIAANGKGRSVVESTQRTLGQFRKAIRQNEIAFPSPTLQFPCQSRPDVQWRVAELFLVHGWTCARLAARYAVTRGRIWWFVRTWVNRAVALGYLQDIPPADTMIVAANPTGGLVQATMPLYVQHPPLPAASNEIHIR